MAATICVSSLRVSADSLNYFFNKIDKVDSTIGLEMSLIVVEAIRGRCASFMILTATVSEIFAGQTNSSILVVLDVLLLSSRQTAAMLVHRRCTFVN